MRGRSPRRAPAITVFDGVAGVELQSETVWRQADRCKVLIMCFANRLDGAGANFYRCVDMIVDRLGATVLVLLLLLYIGKGQMGSALTGSLQIVIFVDGGFFGYSR